MRSCGHVACSFSWRARAQKTAVDELLFILDRKHGGGSMNAKKSVLSWFFVAMAAIGFGTGACSHSPDVRGPTDEPRVVQGSIEQPAPNRSAKKARAVASSQETSVDSSESTETAQESDAVGAMVSEETGGGGLPWKGIALVGLVVLILVAVFRRDERPSSSGPKPRPLTT